MYRVSEESKKIPVLVKISENVTCSFSKFNNALLNLNKQLSLESERVDRVTIMNVRLNNTVKEKQTSSSPKNLLKGTVS